VTRLEALPARIDELTSRVSHLRSEMRGEFSAVRAEMATGLGGLEVKTNDLAIQMRVLHEDVIARLALLQEGLLGSARRKRRKK
jgi:hypothetical protein